MVKRVVILLLLSIVASQASQYDSIPDNYEDYGYDEEAGSGAYEYGDAYYDDDDKTNYGYGDVPANSDDEDNYGSGNYGSGEDVDTYDEDEGEVVEMEDQQETTAVIATEKAVDVTTSTPALETKSSTSNIPKEEEGEIDVPTTEAPKIPETPKRKHPHNKNKNKNKEVTEEKEEVELDVKIIQQKTSFSLSDGHFLTAAIIGGCIGFLFAVALIMLLLYRMRKKDEGSFSLQDGKKKKGGPPGYQYAQGQEYYA